MALSVIITADGLDADRTVRRYAEKKMASLMQYLPREDRSNAAAAVALKRVDRPHGNKYEVGVTLRFGDQTVTAMDSTLNVFAALDIVHAELLAILRDLRYNLS